MLNPNEQPVIDRKIVEYPPGMELRRHIVNLNCPTAIAFDRDGTLVVAEGGYDGIDVHISAYRPGGESFEIYPKGLRLPTDIITKAIISSQRLKIRGPVGGLTVSQGKIYLSHRDDRERGLITAITFEGYYSTIVADLPAQGDHSVTDLAVSPSGRLYFGVGTATNSGVVGIDNFPWVQDHRNLADRPGAELHLLGRRFDTPNPFAGIFGGADIAVTAPFQPFAHSIDTRIPKADDGKPNGAIYSVDLRGGDLRVEALGLRYPAGLRFSEQGILYFTNQGMKLRGTRPVKDDPDVLLRFVAGQWYGWPDFSANLQPIRDARYQPPVEMIVKTGYRDLSFLLDHESSNLTPPNPNSRLVLGEFKPLAGAAKFDFVPPSGPFAPLRKAGNVAVVALMGDRAPFDTGGLKMVGPTGYKLMLVNVDERQTREFVRNTLDGPSSLHDSEEGLERPIDAKFGPDGNLYIVDFGRMRIRDGREQVRAGSGRIFRLTVGLPKPTTKP